MTSVTIPMEAIKRAAHRVRTQGAADYASGRGPSRLPFGSTLRAIVRETHFGHLRGPLWRVFVAREVVTTSVFFGTHSTIKDAMIVRVIEISPVRLPQPHCPMFARAHQSAVSTD